MTAPGCAGQHSIAQQDQPLSPLIRAAAFATEQPDLCSPVGEPLAQAAGPILHPSPSLCSSLSLSHSTWPGWQHRCCVHDKSLPQPTLPHMHTTTTVAPTTRALPHHTVALASADIVCVFLSPSLLQPSHSSHHSQQLHYQHY